MDNETDVEQVFDNEDTELELDLELDEEPDEEVEDKITLSKSEWDKSQQTLGSLKREIKSLKKTNEPKGTPTNELNDTQLNYLDVKGIYESEDVKVIETFVRNTGKNVREAFRDDYVIAKLASNNTAREIQVAMPSDNKRGGNQSGDLASALAKYEATKLLPTDFKERSEVIDAFLSKGNGSNKPSWQ